MKRKISLVIAVLVLAGAVVTGAWALLSRDSQESASSAPTTGPASSDPGAEETKAAGKVDLEGIKIPKKRVSPLKGQTYCETARLLAIYAQQGYGLNKQLGVVDGEQFALRLKTIGATYTRLSQQAAGTPEVGAAAAEAWRELGAVTTSAERTLRTAGLQVQSELMIPKLAKVADVGRVQLPKATSTLKAACGFSQGVFGL